MSVIVIWFCLYISPDKSFNYIAGTIFCGGGGCFVFNFLLGVIVQAYFPDQVKMHNYKDSELEKLQSIIDEVRGIPEYQGDSTRYAALTPSSLYPESRTINHDGIEEILNRANISAVDLLILKQQNKVNL